MGLSARRPVYNPPAMASPIDEENRRLANQLLGAPVGSGERGIARIISAARQDPWLFLKLAGGGLALVVAGAVAVGAVSLLNVWVLVGLTLALAAVVGVRTYRQQQRTWWIDQGCCAACGYDLTGLPTKVCPECGRDSAQDEPTWRRLRREHEAKFGRTPQAAETFAAGQMDEAEIQKLLARARAQSMDL